jgi:O-antigen/teichoic acid export membrane protein
VEAYGQYQEFMIYAMLLISICSFSVDSSLTYFLPSFPDRERPFITQTSAITLVMSTLCVSLLLLASPLFIRVASYDFVGPLAAYVFFFVNLNWFEYYWIAKRRPQIVLYYTALRLLIRVGVLLAVAYATRDVATILWSLVVVEACRVVVMLAYCFRRGLFAWDIHRSEVLEQLRFAVPIGSASLVQHTGRSIGKLVVGSTLGPAALAYYSAGSYLQPIIRVLRKGVEDAVYPDLVRAREESGAALRLWQRVNVLNCAIFFPAFVLAVYYAEQIVTMLFTDAYLPAVPVFQIYAVFLLRRCFNTDVLLRTTGRTGFMLWGAIGALAVNVVLILMLSRAMGLIGPAIAFIAAELTLEIYFAWRACATLGMGIGDLADWSSIGKVALSCAVAGIILVADHLLPGPELVRIGVASIVFMCLALLLAFRLGVSDVGRVAGFVWSRVVATSRRWRPTSL